MKQRFNNYTDTELIALDNETINDAIRIEAIEQGVQPPLPLSEALRKSEWRGYQKPQEAVTVFEIIVQNEYGHEHASGIGYLTKEAAEAALNGVVFIQHDTYSQNPGFKIHNKGCAVAQRLVGISKADQAWAKLEEFNQDTEAFSKISDACIQRLSDARQADYNRRVNAEKKAEYLRLSGGDEAIAKGFWAKVEKTEWPNN